MSISIIAPKPLLRLCKCLETKLEKPNAVTTPHHVSCQEKPRVVFTFIPPSSENLMDELVATLGPLDVVVDCFSDGPKRWRDGRRFAVRIARSTSRSRSPRTL